MLRTLVLGFVLHAAHAAAWQGKEHRAIGDAVFQQALAELQQLDAALPAKLARASHIAMDKESGTLSICAVNGGKSLACFSFGELLAIYGDWAEDVAEVNHPSIVQRAAALKYIVKDNDLSKSKSEYDRMMALARTNFTHFSGDALKAYAKHHETALQLAGDPSRLWEALHYEALALHSFTDLFAFGHMLEERERTRKLVEWAEANPSKWAQMEKEAGGALMGGLVNFYHNAWNWRGAKVRNAAGDIWTAYGDRKLGIGSDQWRVIVSATAQSLRSVLNVALGLPNPAGYKFAPTLRLPIDYWDSQRPVAFAAQLPLIVALGARMYRNGQPMSDGFDFSLGILKFEPGEMKGTVPYAKELETLRAGAAGN